MERSGRALDVGSVHVGLTGDLQPTVRFKELRIANAKWAEPRAFVDAREIRFIFSWRSLTESEWLVARLKMVDADVDMEIMADGLRNWRLSNPGDHGPGRVRVLTLDAVRSRVHLVHGAADVIADMAVADLSPDQRAVLAQAPSLPLTKRFEVTGRRAALAFAASAKISDLLTFIGTGESFAAQGSVRAPHTQIGFVGRISDLAHVEACDLDVTLVSGNLAALRALAPQSTWPALPASGSATVRRDARTWSIDKLQASVGHSDVAGNIRYDDGDGDRRPTLRATLASKALHVADLAAWAPARDKTKPDFDRWRATDADVDLRIARIEHTAFPITDVHIAATLRRGAIEVPAFQAALAGGRVKGTMKADLNAAIPKLSAQVDAAELSIESLARSPVSGALTAHAAIDARGDSVETILRTLSGRVDLSMTGGAMPKALDAKMALDGPAIVAAMFSAQARVPIRCAHAVLQIDKGNGEARELVMETERSIVAATGNLNVANRTVDLMITPHVRQRSLLSLRRAIHVTGPISAPQVSLADATESAAPGGCST